MYQNFVNKIAAAKIKIDTINQKTMSDLVKAELLSFELGLKTYIIMITLLIIKNNE